MSAARWKSFGDTFDAIGEVGRDILLDLAFRPTLAEHPLVEHSVPPRDIAVRMCIAIVGIDEPYRTSRYPEEWPGRECGQWELWRDA